MALCADYNKRQSRKDTQFMPKRYQYELRAGYSGIL